MHDPDYKGLEKQNNLFSHNRTSTGSRLTIGKNVSSQIHEMFIADI